MDERALLGDDHEPLELTEVHAESIPYVAGSTYRRSLFIDEQTGLGIYT